MLHSSLECVRKDEPLNLRWRAFELQPREAPVDPAARDAKHARIRAGFDRLQAVAREQYGVTLAPGLLGIDTRLAHQGAKVAEAMDVAAPYHQRVFAAHWQQGLDISDPDVLADIAEAIGLDRSLFAQALALAETQNAVLQDEQQASRYGLSGVPAMLFAGRFLASGAMPEADLRAAIAEVRAHLEREARQAPQAPGDRTESS